MIDPSARIAELEAELALALEKLARHETQGRGGAASSEAAADDVDHVIARLQSRVQEKSEALAQTSASYQALYDNMPDMVLTLDNQGRIKGCNQTAELGLERVEPELIGTMISDVFDVETGAALLAVYASGFEGAGDSDVSLPDGRTLGFSIARIDDQRKQLVLRDVTPRQRLQAELLNTRRMASVGRLAGGIAHEINNPLAVIQGRVEMLRAVPEMPAEARERHLNILEEHCQRVARIVQNLHTFARPRPPDRKWLPVRACVTDAISSLGLRLSRVHLEIGIGEALRVNADPDQLRLVLVNLLSNAAEASHAGAQVRVSAEAREDGAVEVRIEDEGSGLSEAMMSELHAPYAAGAGSVEAGRGLGLSISWGIVQEHGGWLTAENLAPRGSRVVFHIPDPEASSEGESSPTAREWSILVVDDDRVMCETIAWMLMSEGHRIVSVHTAEEAITKIESSLFDIVITDQRLPGMTGEGLIEVIGQRWPELLSRTVLTSGLLYHPKQTRRYLQKPFSQQQLLKLLGELEA